MRGEYVFQKGKQVQRKQDRNLGKDCDPEARPLGRSPWVTSRAWSSGSGNPRLEPGVWLGPRRAGTVL